MKIYIMEFKPKTRFSIITAFTRTKYNHTEMLIQVEKPDKFLRCSLSCQEEGFFYQNKKLLIENMTAYSLSVGEIIDIFRVPKEFTGKQIQIAIDHWKTRIEEKKKYSFRKLALFPIYLFFMPFYRLYYRRRKVPYVQKIDIPDEDVCSTEIDTCLKKTGYDIFPELSERVAYPGLFARKLNHYRVRVMQPIGKK